MARILIIEDEEVIRDLLRDVLGSQGHTVEEAADGRIGVEMFRKNPADLVITDIMMPNLNGLEVVRQLRAEFPDAKIISIAAVGESLLEQARELGADRTFDKPFRVDEIVKAIDELLEK